MIKLDSVGNYQYGLSFQVSLPAVIRIIKFKLALKLRARGSLLVSGSSPPDGSPGTRAGGAARVRQVTGPSHNQWSGITAR